MIACAIPFTFDEENHIYKVPGQFVLSTSDVIAMCGFSDFSQVPKHILSHASWRGTQLHKAIELFEKGTLDMESIPDEVMPYFIGYCGFRTEHDFLPTGEVEHRTCYEHVGTGNLIGCTIDIRGTLGQKPYVLDIKTSAKQYGKAKAQTSLKWRLQLQSYLEASEAEEFLIEGKAIVQVDKEGSYAFHDFPMDDSHLWDSAVRIAQAKLANGYSLEKR